MKVLTGSMAGKGLKIGVVVARFNSEITSKLETGAIEKLKEIGVQDENIVLTSVPGAFEIPLIAQELLLTGLDGIVAIGCVIRGETTHYDYVCSAVERGCTELQLKFGKPVVFCVLTTEDAYQAFDRAGGRYGNKGSEAAEVVVEMINLKKEIQFHQPLRKELNV